MPNYPGIAEDYARTFKAQKDMQIASSIRRASRRRSSSWKRRIGINWRESAHAG